MGYVGLPLGLHFAKSGCDVVGFDIDPVKVEQLNRGESYILHISAESIEETLREGKFRCTCDFSEVSGCSSVIICVPTPLKDGQDPDLSFVLATGEAIAPHIKSGTLVVLESTTYPGTTDTELRGVLEKGSKMVAGRDFFLAYSPEREDPGNPQSLVAEIPKVVGGLTAECQKRALELYGRAIKVLVPVESCRVAEAVKLTENIFRAVNIAMVNELKTIYHKMDIDIWSVIEAAKTKPFGFMPFYPGPGLGGHCIPIDPFYLSWKAREYGQETRFIELAGEINRNMPEWVVGRLEQALASVGKTLNGSRILMIGIAYKANVDDDRESPAYVLWELMESKGAHVSYHDPHVPVIRPTREHSQFQGIESQGLDEDTLKNADAVLIATPHRVIDWPLVSKWAQLVVDSRNVLSATMNGDQRYFKA
tara:strand:+ start:2371 stop:3636 length:1266 start_codon:yes stop_codon:yes gene_type:complete